MLSARATVRSRRAFTLIEIIAAVVIITTLAAVVVPTVVRSMRTARTAAVANQIHSILNAAQAFRRDVGRWPRRLDHLVATIATNQTDVCGVAYSAANVTKWRGPYLPIASLFDGTATDATTIPMNEGALLNLLTPSTGTGILEIEMTGLDTVVIRDLEFQYDVPTIGPANPTPSYTTGMVQRDVPANTGQGLEELRFRFPVRC